MLNGHSEQDSPSPQDSTMADNISISDEEYPEWFIQRHGRDFHKIPSPYFLPADRREMERLNIQHRLLKQLLNGNIFGPMAALLVDVPGREKRVVDLGSGSGIWAEEMALAFPHVKFIGIDLVPTATQYPPSNAQFECYDFLAGPGLRCRDASIDAIHARCITSGVNDYARLAQESLRALLPGGGFHSAELDFRPEFMTVRNGSLPIPATREVIRRMIELVPQALAPPSIPSALETAGFTEVTSNVEWVPIGDWMNTDRMKTIGRTARSCLVELVNALSPALIDQAIEVAGAVPGAVVEVVAEVAAKEVDDLLTRAGGEITALDAEVSIPYHLVHARRPS
ncbi:hypothetical protein FRB95_003418 [Tulasnella sp. JGI-2019a]|nr:hypothetical protein FRB95_003418 [Tulasnella sp. JGI-2019a]